MIGPPLRMRQDEAILVDMELPGWPEAFLYPGGNIDFKDAFVEDITSIRRWPCARYQTPLSHILKLRKSLRHTIYFLHSFDIITLLDQPVHQTL